MFMPANLPPEYFSAEKRYKEAGSPREKIAALEELISTVPKHKGTDKLRADLRRKLSQLREEATKKKKGGRGDLYAVERQGAGQIALVGFANAGKSALVGALTNAEPVVADYPMSTVMPLAAMMPFEDIQYQLVDLPPLGNESTDGWVSGILRSSDMLLLVLDLGEDPDVQAELLIAQLEEWRIPLKHKGEKGQMTELGKPVIIVGNKADLNVSRASMDDLSGEFGGSYPLAEVSTISKDGLEELRRTIFECSGVLRVYSKQPGKDPDLKMPFIVREGSTVLDLAGLIHKDFVEGFKYACIWGSAKFDGQRVQKDHVLSDRDIVEYHVK